MRQADHALEDEKYSGLFMKLSCQDIHRAARGGLGTSAEIVLRMLILKHIRNWSFDVIEREVRSKLSYRDFKRVYAGRVPDAKMLGR
jgi:IS5 family transposase